MADFAFALGADAVPFEEVDSPKTDHLEKTCISTVVTEEQKNTGHPLVAGEWLLAGYASAAVGKSSREVYAGRVSIGYHFVDGLSLNLEEVGYFINQENDTGALGLDLLPRWHYLRENNWSLYLDGGVGLIYSTKRMGHSGTHFNFTLQGGMGTTYQLSDRAIPMASIRWFHISNARIKGKQRNVGFDSPLFYLGIMMPLRNSD